MVGEMHRSSRRFAQAANLLTMTLAPGILRRLLKFEVIATPPPEKRRVSITRKKAAREGRLSRKEQTQRCGLEGVVG
jgi:hypothetical protein